MLPFGQLRSITAFNCPITSLCLHEWRWRFELVSAVVYFADLGSLFWFRRPVQRTMVGVAKLWAVCTSSNCRFRYCLFLFVQACWMDFIWWGTHGFKCSRQRHGIKIDFDIFKFDCIEAITIDVFSWNLIERGHIRSVEVSLGWRVIKFMNLTAG